MPVRLNKKLEIRLKSVYQAVWWWGSGEGIHLEKRKEVREGIEKERDWHRTRKTRKQKENEGHTRQSLINGLAGALKAL